MSNVKIEDNVTLTNCIIGKDAVIRSKSNLKGNVLEMSRDVTLYGHVFRDVIRKAELLDIAS